MGIDHASYHSLAALLDWLRAMGADCAVGPMATNWLDRGDEHPAYGFTLMPAVSTVEAMMPPPPSARTVSQPAMAVARATSVAPSSAETAARRVASAADTLEALEAGLRAFEGCGLKATAKNLCFYRGASQARVMIIGEAPGRDEDLEGQPFVGRAGQLLDRMLSAIGLSENDVHITNIVYWRPPGNRTPTPQEAQACRPFLERQMELVSPQIVLLLGGAAAKQILDTADGIMRIRGRWRELAVGVRRVRALPSLHPAYLLRTPAAKKLAWRDLLLIKSELIRLQQ